MILYHHLLYIFHNIFYGLINIKYTKFILIVLLAEIPLTFAINSIGISLKTYSQDQTIASGVLAGPVTITGTQTITGTVVVI